jgi:hypothetical protein
MMRKLGVLVLVLVVSAVIVTGILAQTGAVSTDEPQAPATSTRTYEIPGQFAFDYPLDVYSVDTSGCEVASAGLQGAIEVKPNDSFIYGANRNTYSVKIAAITNDVYTETDLPSLLGTLPLLQYEPTLLEGKEVQALEINGHHAVRVDDVGAGLSGITAHMIILGEGQLVEVVIEPYSFAAEAPDEDTENASRSVAQGIIDSIRWEMAS